MICMLCKKELTEEEIKKGASIHAAGRGFGKLCFDCSERIIGHYKDKQEGKVEI